MPVADERLSSLQVLKLLQAVHNKDIDNIRKLVQHGLPNLVNYAEPTTHQTGLHSAAIANNVEIISQLINLGADCNMVDVEGKSPFIKAAEYGHIQALACLLELCKRPDLSVKDKEGKNILYHCLIKTKRHQQCLELSLRYGANVHVVCNDGKSLLIKACEENLDEAVRTLLQSSIDVNKKMDKTSEVALHFSCSSGYQECSRLLLKYGGDPDIMDKYGQSPAHRAAANGHLHILRTLSAFNADFSIHTYKKETAMHFAAEKGYGAVCKFLGQRGCPATSKNTDGALPRVIAKENEHKDAMKECKKAEKFKGTKPGTQLHLVKFYDWIIENKSTLEIEIESYDPEVEGCRYGKVTQEDLIMVLKAHNPQLTDDQLVSILKLHDAEKSGQIDYELLFAGKKYVNKQFLVDGGKKKKGGGKKGGKKKKGKTKVDTPICTNETNIRPKDGGPLLFYVKKQEQITDSTRFDRDHPPLHPIQDDSFWYSHQHDPSYVHLNEVIKSNDKESLVSAIQNGLDINSKDKYYKTPLMLACLEGNYKMAEYMISQGADIKATDNFKWTALHFTCHSGQKDIAELLVNNGAILDAQSFNGGTPLMRAIESSKVEIILWLIQKGAKIQIENKKGQTALDIAKAYGDPRVINIIQERWDQMPPPIDKRRKTSPKKKSEVKASASSTRLSMPNIRVSDHNNKTMKVDDRTNGVPLLKSTYKLSDVTVITESVVYEPKIAWLSQENTSELLSDRKEKRNRYGYEVDFDDYKPPFQKHVDILVKDVNDNT